MTISPLSPVHTLAKGFSRAPVTGVEKHRYEAYERFKKVWSHMSEPEIEAVVHFFHASFSYAANRSTKTYYVNLINRCLQTVEYRVGEGRTHNAE